MEQQGIAKASGKIVKNRTKKNGILPGKKLILTYESERYPLNDRIVDEYINEYFPQCGK